MTTAADRLNALDQMPALELCDRAGATLDALAATMNEETTLLRTGRYREAGGLSAEKTRLAQDYVALARAVQRQSQRILIEAPGALDRLRAGHERLATQMAENLRVIATARAVADDLLTDVARSVSRNARPKTYGAAGEAPEAGPAAPGISVNRAL